MILDPTRQLPERTETFDPTSVTLPDEVTIGIPPGEGDMESMIEKIYARQNNVLDLMAPQFATTGLPIFQFVPVTKKTDPKVEDGDPVLTSPDYAQLSEEYARATARTIPRPETWDDIIGNTRSIELIREAIAAAKAQKIPLQHMLLFGPPGVGKSTISKMIARDMNSGCIETTASTLETPVDVLRVLQSMNTAREKTGSPSVLFVDEIHMLGSARGRASIDQESIYPLLEDWVFFHNCQGKKIAFGPDNVQTVLKPEFLVWPFTCIGATTEPGVLSQALQRRFLIQIELEPYTEDDIAEILLRAGQRMLCPVTEEAAQELSQYARLNPGRAFSLLAHARNKMFAAGAITISSDVARAVVEQNRLYPQGLTETDVRVLEALAERMPKGIGQAELSRALGISLTQFSNMIEPYLRQMGFIQTLNRRVLTTKGLLYLARIGRADVERPEIRASLNNQLGGETA